LTVLSGAGEPLSTTDVRERINRGRDRALVAEQVYRALIGMQQAGAVRRVHVADSRKAFWKATVDVTREEVS
jgi:Fe2+ or Zn2+ uptake regulation protein